MNKYTSTINKLLNYLKFPKLTLLIISLGVFLALSFIVTNGDYRCAEDLCGLWIGQWHKHDYIWHLALIKTSFNSQPLMHPNYSGAILEGYNYFLDYIVYLFSKIGIPPLVMFFKILPIIFYPPYLYFLIKSSQMYHKSNSYLNSFLFFTLLGASFSYLISLYVGRGLYYSTLAGFPVVTSIQPTTIFLNMQYAYSLLCLIAVLYIMQQNNRKLWLIVALFVLSAAAVSLKFYAAIVLTLLVGTYGIMQVVKSRSFRPLSDLLLPTALGIIFSASWFYNPFKPNLNAGFAIDPFAITHLMTEDGNLFYNQYLTHARYYLEAIGVSPRLVAIEAINILLFLLVNYGTRLIGIVGILIKIKNKEWTIFDTSLLLTISMLTLLPIVLVQRGSFYNSMQFLYYAIFLSSYFAAYTLYLISNSIKNRMYSGILIIVIILATIPSHLDQLRYLLEPQLVIRSTELDALNHLAKLPFGDVFVTFSHKKDAYVSAISGKPTYFTDIDQLDVTGIKASDREQLILKPTLIEPRNLDVEYWYLRKGDEDFTTINDKIKNDAIFQLIFENSDIILYQKNNSATD